MRLLYVNLIAITLAVFTFAVLFGHAQAAVYSEDFDGMTAGQHLCNSTIFVDPGSCTAQGGLGEVTTDEAASAPHSLHRSLDAEITGTRRADLNIATNTTGIFSFKYLVNEYGGFQDTISIYPGGSDGNTRLNIDTSGSIRLQNSTQTFLSTSTPYDPGEWTEIAVEWDKDDEEWRLTVQSPSVQYISEWTEGPTTNWNAFENKVEFVDFMDVTNATRTPYFDDILVRTDGDVPVAFCDSGESRICSLSPADNSTTTINTTFELDVFVNEDDLTNVRGVEVSLRNIDQNVLLLGSLSPSSIIFLQDFDIEEAGHFEYSSTTVLGEGNYRVRACIDRTYFGFIDLPWSTIDECISHQFVVGDETFIGSISQRMFDDTQEFYSDLNATSSEALANSCNPLNSNFGIRECIAFMFLPDASDLNLVMEDARSNILNRVPWGYVTRFVDIISSDHETNLPTFTTNVVVGPGSGGTTTESLTFDPGDMIAGGGALLESIKDPIHGQSARDIFEPFVQLTVALAVLLTIVADVARSHGHDKGESRDTRLS